jgi:hypothetical protein
LQNQEVETAEYVITSWVQATFLCPEFTNISERYAGKLGYLLRKRYAAPERLITAAVPPLSFTLRLELCVHGQTRVGAESRRCCRRLG